MSDIQLYKQITDLTNVPTRTAEIQIALSTRMIKDISHQELFEIMKSNISKSYMLSRFSAPEAVELVVIVDETMKMAKSKYGTIREAEISIAFTRGLAKEYGDYMGLSFITFMAWLAGYVKEEARIKLTTPIPSVKPEPSLEERFQLALSNAVSAYEEYKSGIDIQLKAVTVYRFLMKIKVIAYSDEEQDDFMKQAGIDVREELHHKIASSLDRDSKSLFKRALEDEVGMDNKIINQARRLGLYSYFQSAIMEEVDLKQVILDHKPKF